MKYLVQPIVCHSLNTPGTEANKARTYAILAPQTGMAASITPGSRYLEQQPWVAGAHQTFRFIPVDGAWCVIEVASSGKVLDVDGGSTEDGVRIQEWDRHDGHNQQFRLLEGDPGRTFAIAARHSGKHFDLQDYTKGAGGVIYQHVGHNKINQQWMLSEVRWNEELSDLTATIYADGNFQGASQPLGIGSFDIDKLRLGNDTISSIKVPAGLRVTVFADHHFSGTRNSYHADVAALNVWNDRISSIIVEQVVSLHGTGSSPYRIGIGRYLAQQLNENWVGNDRLRSLTVPRGLMVILFEHDKFKGDYISVTEDTPNLPAAWANRVSSVIVKQTGLYIPDDTLRYGSRISLVNVGTKGILDPAGGALGTTQTIDLNNRQKFTLIRSGTSVLRSHVCYGDIVSLKTPDDKYVVAEKDGAANANRDGIGSWEKWEVIRSGDSKMRSFVSRDDVLTLRSIAHDRYLVANNNAAVDANATKIEDKSRWRVASFKPVNAVAPELRTSACGGDACAANVCPAELCGADACGAATCTAANSVVGVCAAAATSYAACGVDVAAVAVGGISACVTAATGIGACGADVCGAAACIAAACGAAACGAAACGADACGVAATGASLCVTNAGGIDLCGADACAYNACGVNLCPADACAVDACGVDMVPILPFI